MDASKNVHAVRATTRLSHVERLLENDQQAKDEDEKRQLDKDR